MFLDSSCGLLCLRRRPESFRVHAGHGSRTQEQKSRMRAITRVAYAVKIARMTYAPRGLMSAVGVDVQADWYNVGLELGLEPSTLESINRSYGHDLSRCMTRVFIVWHESQSSEYSWKKLAEVLCSRTVNKPYLLPKMLERTQHCSV